MRLPIEPEQTSFIEEAVAAWGDTVYRVALKRTGSPDEADDVYQEVFEKLLEASQDFASSEHLKAWLIRVTINRCRDHQKAHSFSRTDSLESHRAEAERKLATTLEENASTDGFSEEMNRALSKLPEDQRTAVDLFYQRDLSTSEIASATGATPGAVRTQLYRARRTLRRLLTAGAVVFAAVLVGLLAVNGAPSENEEAPAHRAPAAVNFFALRAWAAPDGAAPTTITPSEPLSVGWLHPQYWDPNYNPEDPFEEGPVNVTGIACTTFNFDAQCVGSNLASITYKLTGSEAWFSYEGADEALASYRDSCKSITIDYANPEAVQTSTDVIIEVIQPLSDNLKKRYEDATQDDHYDAYWSEVVPAGFVEAARALEGSELILTATFTDGSTQTKTYRFALVPNFEHQSQLLVQRIIEEWGRHEGRVVDHGSLPSLVMLEQIN